MRFKTLLSLYQELLTQEKQYQDDPYCDEHFVDGYRVGVYDLFQVLKLECKKTYSLDPNPKNKEKYLLADLEFLCLLKYRGLTLPVYRDEDRYFCYYGEYKVFGFSDLNPWDWITAQLDCLLDNIKMK